MAQIASRRYTHEQMTGVFCELVDYDRLYESVSDEAILINNFDSRDEEQKQRLDQLLYTIYDSDTLDTKPSCDCGELKGEFNRGIRCPHCQTQVMTVVERPMESILWARVPDGVHAFISPGVWNILNQAISYKSQSINILRYLADPHYRVKNTRKFDPNTDPLIQYFRQHGWRRSINTFIENFDWMMEVLLEWRSQKVISPNYRKEMLRKFIADNRDRMFPKYLPIPNRSVLITEKTPMATYVDEIMGSAINAVRTLSSIDAGISLSSQQEKENRTIKAISQLAEYYMAYTKNNLGSKPGLFRRQVYGSRLDFSGRAVITSLSHPHHYHELHFPWGLSVLMLKSHLTSKLLKRGFTPDQCESFLLLHINHYDPLLDQLFNELISESPYPGLPVLLQRNPSLVRGSAQQLYITQIKTDVKDNTIGFSVLCLAAPNADFDGDEMNAELLIDEREHDAFEKLAPHYGVLDTHQPLSVSGNVKIPPPVMSTWVNFIHENE